jgi:hypothetical protein
LWGYPHDDPFLDFLQEIFSDTEAYEPDYQVFVELVEDMPDYYFHNEQELRRRIAEHLVRLEHSQK